MLIVGVEGILSPFGGLFINASYVLGIAISCVGVVMSIVFMIAYRSDEKFNDIDDQLAKAAYADFVLNFGACFGLLYANATNWKAKSQVELSN